LESLANLTAKSEAWKNGESGIWVFQEKFNVFNNCPNRRVP
jgi:hypothetical protein